MKSGTGRERGEVKQVEMAKVGVALVVCLRRRSSLLSWLSLNLLVPFNCLLAQVNSLIGQANCGATNVDLPKMQKQCPK